MGAEFHQESAGLVGRDDVDRELQREVAVKLQAQPRVAAAMADSMLGQSRQETAADTRQQVLQMSQDLPQLSQSSQAPDKPTAVQAMSRIQVVAPPKAYASEQRDKEDNRPQRDTNR